MPSDNPTARRLPIFLLILFIVVVVLVIIFVALGYTSVDYDEVNSNIDFSMILFDCF